MMKSALSILLLLLTADHTYASNEFEAYRQKENAAFKAYTEKMEREWKIYLAEIENNFGTVELTSDKKWVNYSKNKRSRFSLDYDKGIITVEFVADEKGKKAAVKEARELIREKSKEINPFSKVPTLTENVDPGKLKLEEAEPAYRSRKDSRQVYRITVPLNEDRQENNEVQIAESVRDMTFKYNVSYDLVMAIIKTESNFNIGAGSKKETLDIRNPDVYENNPWGLMQIVPLRSGREGWKKARGKDKVPTADELLDPRTNLELGVAYLSLLQYHYFDGVKNGVSRELVMISAYRQGPEKVYGIFSDKGKKKEAVEQINRLKPGEVTGWLSGKIREKTAPKAPLNQYVKKVEKERANYRVEEKERKELEKVAKRIVKKPELLATVKGWLGTPYRYGGNSRKAVDCSAFTMNVYSQAYSRKIPRTSNQQYTRYGRSSVKKRDRKEGDLIYFKTLYNGKPVSHVGIWLDEDRFVHASSSKGVVISNLSRDRYWSKRYVGANRPAKGR
ncbi:MAG: C40 family peptidase [Proteobacteria bacterium]|nr:C40 family peptidase [Pseudomonadota bacterium]